MKISKVDNARFYRDHESGALIKELAMTGNGRLNAKRTVRRLNSIQLKEHINNRIKNAKSTFEEKFTMVRTNIKDEKMRKCAEEFSNIIKDFLIAHYTKITDDDNNHIKVLSKAEIKDYVSALNKLFKSKKIDVKVLSCLGHVYKDKITNLLFRHKGVIVFDVYKTTDINNFFKYLLKIYDKNKDLPATSKYKNITDFYMHSLTSNKISFHENKLGFIKNQVKSYMSSSHTNVLKDVYERLRFLLLSSAESKFYSDFSKESKFTPLDKIISGRWTIHAWRKAYAFSKSQYSKLNEKIKKEHKYAYSLIFQSLKDVIIDLKPKKNKDVFEVKMYAGYKDVRFVELAKVINLIINKAMGKIKNQFTANVIAFGKQIYINEKLNKKTGGKDIKSLTGLHYEVQKAHDEIRLRNITAISFATNTINNLFNKDYNKNDTSGNAGEFLDLARMAKKKTIADFKPLEEISANLGYIFTFESVFNCFKKSDNLNVQLVNQIIKSLYSLRNNGFHFINKSEGSDCATENSSGTIDSSQSKNNSSSATEDNELQVLINNELQEYLSLYIEKITSTQLLNYYEQKDVFDLFKELIIKEREKIAYMPSLNKIKKHLTLLYKEKTIMNNDVKSIEKRADKNDDVKKVKTIVDAQLFLLSEVYHKLFTKRYLNHPFQKEVINKVKEMYEKDIENGKEVFQSVEEVLNQKTPDDKEKTMSKVASELLIKYTMANITSNKKKKGVHFKIILNHLTALEFESYILDTPYLKFIANVNENNSNTAEEINQLKEKLKPNNNLLSKNINTQFYLLARLVPNSIANDLLNSYSKFSQFIVDISSRFKSLGINEYNTKDKILSQLNYGIDDIEKIKRSIAYAIEFNSHAKPTKDYDKDTYINHIKPFFEKEDENLIKALFFQNDKQPIEYKSIITLHKLFIYDKFKQIYKHKNLQIKCSGIGEYLVKEKNLLKIENIQNQIADKKVTQDEWQYLNAYNALKNHVLLQSLNVFAIVFTNLQSMLIGYSYKWERDFMYFLLAVSALNSDSEEIYAFDEKIENLFVHNKKVYGVSNSNKKITNHFEKLFNVEYETLKKVRNAIAHFDAFKTTSNSQNSIPQPSLFSLFVDVYESFRWDRKLQNSVFKKFINVLDKYGVDISKGVIRFKQSKEPAVSANKPNVNIQLDIEKNKNIKLKQSKLKTTEGKYLTAVNKHKSFGYNILTLLSL